MGKSRLSAKERGRLDILSKVKQGVLTLVKAAALLGVSYRQIRRVYKRYLAGGNEGLMHGLRDHVSNHRIDSERRARILDLYRSKYEDFGPTLAVEYLCDVDGETLSEETLRRWLIKAGLWHVRSRGAAHRKWRERREHWGELVQMDGSEHDWFEGRRAKASLMVMIDDATNWTHAKFFESETTVAAMSIFEEYVGYYGLPLALYVDRDAIYKTTRDSTVDEALANRMPLTQFGRAMRELEVELILANSSQAKGRVERRHQVFQDRLVKAMRLERIGNLESANTFLERQFLDSLNDKFHVEARSPVNVHRKMRRDMKLRHVLCYREERVVQNDWTVSWCNRFFQLDEAHQKLSLAKKTIEVNELMDGTIRLVYRGRELSWRELIERAPAIKKKRPPTTPIKPPYKPAANHPWRGKGR
jgi:hypothetical protein